MSCGHTFAYWSVIPPTRCEVCGALLWWEAYGQAQFATFTVTTATSDLLSGGRLTAA